MIRSLKMALVGASVLAVANAAHAGLIASSTFNTTTEGWSGVSVPGPAFSQSFTNGSYLSPTTLAPSTPLPDWSATIGNAPSGPGSLRYDETGQNHNIWRFFKAPASFSGSQDMTNFATVGGTENVLGGSLKFDIRIDAVGTPPPVLGPYWGAIFFSDRDTVSTSDDIALIYQLQLASTPQNGLWQAVTVAIPTTGTVGGSAWHQNYYNNNNAISATTFDDVFSDLDAIYINAHWRNVDQIAYLDNVSLNGVFTPTPPAPIPEPSSLVLLLTAGIPAMVAYRRRKARNVA